MPVRPLKDRDEFARALILRTLPFALVAFALAFVTALVMGGNPVKALFAGVIAGAAAMIVPQFIAERSGRIGASVYMASGSSTPAIREYSLAESLAARGLLNEAAQAYEILAHENPDDAEPPLRLARLLRDKMARFEDAADWFRRALAVKGLPAGTEVALLRELSELYTHKLRSPNKALPYLARLLEKHPRSSAAEWARAESAEIKRAMLADYTDG